VYKWGWRDRRDSSIKKSDEWSAYMAVGLKLGQKSVAEAGCKSMSTQT